MSILMFAIGVLLIVGGVWVLIKVRAAPDGTPNPLTAKRGMASVMVFLIMGLMILGLVLMVKALDF